MKLEEWRDIKDYPNYQVSNFGNVKSKERISECCYNSHRKTKERILSTHISNGYKTVCLFKKRKYTKRIHKLVAQEFIPNPKNYSYINHKDGNKLNNCVDNLEWCSASHNVKEAYKLGLAKPSDKQKRIVSEWCKKNKPKPIVQLDINENFIKEWNSAVEVENKIGISRKSICNCIRKKSKTAGGFKWILKRQMESMQYEVK